jgi:hypothetical protein
VRRRPSPLLLTTLLFGCGNLTGGEGGVVALELRLPNPAVVEFGDTIQLQARALDADGDSVGATIVWITPDTTIALDSTGLLTTDTTAGTGRVQARVGNLRSDLVTFTIRHRSDIISLTGATTLTVAPADSASEALVAVIRSVTPDTQGISGSALVYQVVDSATFRDVVHFAGGGQNLRAVTGSDGGPTIPVTLRRNPGATFPATVIVQVSATRPSGTAVPGSGQTFSITFQ